MPRIPYWNIDYGLIIDLLAIPVIIVFFMVFTGNGC